MSVRLRPAALVFNGIEPYNNPIDMTIFEAAGQLPIAETMIYVLGKDGMGIAPEKSSHDRLALIDNLAVGFEPTARGQKPKVIDGGLIEFNGKQTDLYAYVTESTIIDGLNELQGADYVNKLREVRGQSARMIAKITGLPVLIHHFDKTMELVSP